ncbi:MAG: beta-N-acetylglucosaminidase domain-containing protein [Lentisphaeria bacterium]
MFKKLLLSIITLIGAGVVMADDAVGKVPIYQGYILPTPQKITYEKRNIDFSDFTIVSDNPHARYLKKRLVERSGVPGKNGVQLCLGIGPVDGVIPPDKPQGYAVKIIDNTVVLAGSDKLGLLWAVSSLLQMTHMQNGKLVLRAFQGEDWPIHLYRGVASFGTTNWSRDVRLAVTFKLNALYALSHWSLWEKDAKRPYNFSSNKYCFSHDPPKEWLATIRDMHELAELGLEWGVGFNKQSSAFAVSDMVAHRQLMKWIKPVVEAGGTYCIWFDDARFPIQKQDKERFGSAREADSWYANFIDQEVKKIRPDARIIFCPPFYWGPGSDPSARYGESRELYLHTIGEKLSKDIGIIYTGHNVFAGKMEKADTQWITERIRRKPIFYVNDKDSRHMRLMHYATDPVELWYRFYKGVYDDTRLLDVYGNSAWMTVPAASGSEYQWNPKAYDAVHSPLDTLAMLIGAGNCKFAERMNKVVSQTDFCELEITPGAVASLPKIEKMLSEFDQLWQDAVRDKADDALAEWTVFYYLRKRYATYVKNLQKLSKSGHYANQNKNKFLHDASKECGWKDGDVLLISHDFIGGISPSLYKYMQKDPRVMTGVRGTGTHNSMQTTFRLKTISGKADDVMYICGQDDDMNGACSVAITLNDREIFRGKNPLKKFIWDIWKLQLPKGILKEGENILRIATVKQDGDSSGGFSNGGRFFLINYVVIK